MIIQNNLVNFFKIEIHSVQGWTALQGMHLQEKEAPKD